MRFAVSKGAHQVMLCGFGVWCALFSALCITLLLCVDTCQHVDEVHVTIAQMVCLGRSSEAQQDFETWKGHERINSDQSQKIREVLTTVTAREMHHLSSGSSTQKWAMWCRSSGGNFGAKLRAIRIHKIHKIHKDKLQTKGLNMKRGHTSHLGTCLERAVISPLHGELYAVLPLT